jgi:hypothetical protein
VSFDIEGWVEVRRAPSDMDGEWIGVLRLDAVIDVGGPVSEALFGLTKAFVAGETQTTPLAARRGIPANASPQVRSAVTADERFVKSGDMGGHTWASWAEISTIELADEVLSQSDWRHVFAFMKSLADDPNMDAKRVRVVCWFNW